MGDRPWVYNSYFLHFIPSSPSLSFLSLPPSQLPGYTKKTDSGWSFSVEAVKVLRDFMARFPQTFDYLCVNPGNDKYYEQELFPDPEGYVPALRHRMNTESK